MRRARRSSGCRRRGRGAARRPAERLRRWGRPGRRVGDTYGPTETTVSGTYGEVRAGEGLTMGKAGRNHRVYVLDEPREPAGEGIVGEIAIGGVGCARGYVNA